MKKTIIATIALLVGSMAWSQNLRYEVKHLHDSINTTGSETGAVIVDDSIILYTTMMIEESPRLYLVDFNPMLTEIYQAPIDSSGAIGKGMLNHWGLNATGMNNGNVAYDPKNDMLYITRSESGEKSRNHIYYSHRVNKRWSKLQKLKGDVNLNGYNSSHPTIGYLPTGETILYFSSDRPGGLGGMDIWYAILISEGTPGNCTNLGTPVNSDSNDVTPYYCNEEGTLYFSSNRAGGQGNMDVYRAEGMRNSWQAPENLGEEINTGRHQGQRDSGGMRLHGLQPTRVALQDQRELLQRPLPLAPHLYQARHGGSCLYRHRQYSERAGPAASEPLFPQRRAQR